MENSLLVNFDEIWPKTLYYSTGTLVTFIIDKKAKFIFVQLCIAKEIPITICIIKQPPAMTQISQVAYIRWRWQIYQHIIH